MFSLMLFAYEGSECFREPKLLVCCVCMKTWAAPPALPGKAKLRESWPRSKQTGQASETYQPNFAVAPQLCEQTVSDLAERRL